LPDRHCCIKIWLVFAIMVRDGIELEKADHLYDKLKFIFEESRIATKHQCELNKTKTCTYQDHKAKKEGASYSFGCSWNVYSDSCKYAKSYTRITRKYRLANESQEEEMEAQADDMGDILSRMASDAYQNLIMFSKEADSCRNGNGPGGKPFSRCDEGLQFLCSLAS